MASCLRTRTLRRIGADSSQKVSRKMRVAGATYFPTYRHSGINRPRLLHSPTVVSRGQHLTVYRKDQVRRRRSQDRDRPLGSYAEASAKLGWATLCIRSGD